MMFVIQKKTTRVLFIVAAAAAIVGQPLDADDRDSSKQVAKFEEYVRPILATECIKCHGDKKQEGGLRLDSLDAMLTGGDSGPAIVPGEPDESLLVSAIRYGELEMPPKKQLGARQIDAVTAWIRSGAKWPDHIASLRDSSTAISDEDRNWWAFVPRRDVEAPSVTGDTWSFNEIDRFVYKKMDDDGFLPAEPADRETLIRRLYFDVIGLPPTPEQIDAYKHDASADAYEQLVDSLLADKRYGEHWARFWLDLVRYAESDGWKADAYRPNIWRYRDYVVDAFNNDKPYTEFVREQLAGDEYRDPTPDRLAAVGFLRLGIFEYNQRDARKHWDDILNEMTDVTGDVFFGMGMSCARCHDHKFDPILQTDYFQLKAFFEPLIWRDDVPFATEDQISAHEQEMQAWRAMTKDVRQRIDALIQPYYVRKMKATVDKFPLEIQDRFHTPPDQRTSLDEQMAYLVDRQSREEGDSPLKSMKGDDKDAYDALQKELAKYDAQKPADLPKLMTVCNHTGVCSPTIVPGSDEIAVQPGYLTVLDQVCGPADDAPGSQIQVATINQRRTALAEWICRPDNPLTTRVIVNRIWKQHFGTGLVSSSSDFGRLGKSPTHGELLDWLTNDFVENGWTFKRLHKQILMSATWRQAASNRHGQEYRKRDPTVALLWQSSTRRLSAEQIRDSMLAVCGELQESIGGPSVSGSTPRRGLYVKSFRNRPDPFLAEFDVAGGLKSVSKRSNTTTPTQALIMINGKFTLARATAFAQRCESARDGLDARIRHAVRLAWGREPTENELEVALQFMRSAEQPREEENAKASPAMIDFCHVLLNSNEFLYVD